MAGKYQFYESSFKEKAVQLCYENQSIPQVSRELGIRANLLYRWRCEYEKFGKDCFCGKGGTRKQYCSLLICAPQKKSITSKPKLYDSDFKQNAVFLSYKSNHYSQVAKQLGINPNNLYRWRKEYEKYGNGSFCGSGIIRIHPDDEILNKLEKRCYESELSYLILKKATPDILKGKYSAYQFVKNNENTYPIYKMCRILGLSESRYRIWNKQPVSNMKQRIISLKEEIKILFFEHKKNYGCRRITRELHKKGTFISKAQVLLYMKQLGLRSKTKRKYKVTTDSKHNLYTSPNILKRQFKVAGPSKVWVSDITYIQTDRGFLYLTIIMDLFDRKIIGWSLSSKMSAEFTSLAAFEMAVERREIQSGLIFHSDRGVQYACEAFTRKLDSYNCITRSMSRKGNYIDNAPAESFFNTIKRELLYHFNLLSKRKAEELITEYIENWYNKKRIHSSLQYKTIDEFNSFSGL